MLPELFLERLQNIIPQEHFQLCLKSFGAHRPVSIRVNTLKTDRGQVIKYFYENKIVFHEIPFYSDAFVLPGMTTRQLAKWDIVKNGLIYIQSLSSLLPVKVLDPQPGEYIWDMCAAPGSKTTQLAAHMSNHGTVIATENVRDRYYKLRTVVSLMNAEIVIPKFLDGRRLKSEGRFFDRVLVDAPCSSEGRFHIHDPKSYQYWSSRKIKEMVQKQRGLLLSAMRLLKPGGALVYSTCTFAPEENEGVVDWLLRKTERTIGVEAVPFKSVTTYPAVVRWNQKEYSPEVAQCTRVLPGEGREGFFIAKLKKLAGG